MSHQTRKLVIFLVVVELYFLLPLLVCGLAWYEAARAMRRNELSKATLYTKLANPFFQLSNSSYSVSRPALWLFQVSDYTDRVMRIAGYGNQTALTGTDAAARLQGVLPLVMKREKTASDQRTLNETMSHLRQTMPGITNNLQVLAIETQNPQLKELHRATKLLSSIIMASDSLGGNKKEGRFLLLFLNDKELRPGGGFIGSYGIVKLAHYSVRDITIHDVYDADGQLAEHIDPPPPVRDYLQNPHWFLRDSNFSPDFKENAVRAEWFLNKELGPQEFDGVIGITTNTIQEIIGDYGEILLPDSGEIITKDNFYEKTQSAVHENFFPGSRQKQNTLSSLSQGLILEFDRVPKEELAQTISAMFQQKQIAAYMKNESIQTVLEEYGWAGRAQQPAGDFIFPVEANVGVNKVNTNVTRSTEIEVRITGTDSIKHIVKTRFTNAYNGPAPSDNIYKNYHQLFVPPGSAVTSVLFEGRDIGYQVYQESGYTVPAAYVEIPPQSSRTLTVIYTTPYRMNEQENSTYSLLIQKQIGLGISPVRFSLTLPKGSSLLSKDFDAQIIGSTIRHDMVLRSDTTLNVTFARPRPVQSY